LVIHKEFSAINATAFAFTTLAVGYGIAVGIGVKVGKSGCHVDNGVKGRVVSGVTVVPVGGKDVEVTETFVAFGAEQEIPTKLMKIIIPMRRKQCLFVIIQKLPS